MAALEWFESITRLQKRVDDLQDCVASAYAYAGPHGQQMGSVGGGGGHDAMAGIDSLIDTNALVELDRAKAELERRLERASNVLYGKSGRGGLAKASCSDDADILCCHYLQGMGWAEIAKEIVKPCVEYPDKWCRMRAVRACRKIDRIGMDSLADS